MSDLIQTTRDFVLTHGRLLDRLRFAALFEGAPQAPVLAALAAYRGADGLYAHGLEPDKRSPAPQPMDQWEAMGILAECGAAPAAYEALCDHLGALTTPQGGLPFSHPSVSAAPHAPWWGCDAPQPASINPTGGILAYLYQAGVSHPWMAPAAAFCWQTLENGPEQSPHELANALAFLDHAPDRARAQPLRDGLRPLVRAATALVPGAPGYVFSPLDFAPTPRGDGLYAPAELAAHLEHLRAAQAPDGGWPITWPPISPGVEAECRARRSIQALLTLRAYGQL